MKPILKFIGLVFANRSIGLCFLQKRICCYESSPYNN